MKFNQEFYKNKRKSLTFMSVSGKLCIEGHSPWRNVNEIYSRTVLMPKILDRLVSQLRQRGYSAEVSHKIALSSLIKSGNLTKTGKATAKGIRRGNMSPAQRAKSRASKASGRKTSEYSYNPKTNRATLTHGSHL